MTGLPIGDTLLAGIIAVTVSLTLIPFVGMLADRIGRRPVLIAFAVGSALWAWPSLARRPRRPPSSRWRCFRRSAW